MSMFRAIYGSAGNLPLREVLVYFGPLLNYRHHSGRQSDGCALILDRPGDTVLSFETNNRLFCCKSFNLI